MSPGAQAQQVCFVRGAAECLRLSIQAKQVSEVSVWTGKRIIWNDKCRNSKRITPPSRVLNTATFHVSTRNQWLVLWHEHSCYFELVWILFSAYHARASCPQSNTPLHLHCDLLCLSQYSPQSAITVASKIGQTRPDAFEGETRNEAGRADCMSGSRYGFSICIPREQRSRWGGVGLGGGGVVLAVGAVKPWATPVLISQHARFSVSPGEASSAPPVC